MPDKTEQDTTTSRTTERTTTETPIREGDVVEVTRESESKVQDSQRTEKQDTPENK